MDNKKNKQNKGFTFIEILVYLAVLVIIISAISSFFIWIVQSNNKARAMREVINNTERVLQIMTLEIKESEDIYIPTSVFNSHPGQLSLKTKKHLSFGETEGYVDFFLCGTQVCFKEELEDPIALTTDRVEVTNLVFEQIATSPLSPSVKVNLKIDYKTPAENPIYQFFLETATTISLRSY